MKENDLYIRRPNPLYRAVWQMLVIVALAVAAALLTNNMRADGISLVADWSPAARLQAATGRDDLVVPMVQAVAFHTAGEAIFVDARAPEQFVQGHIAGAINIPWEEVYDYLDLIFDAVPDHNTIIIAYCDGEACPLSEELVLLLRDMGYKNARVLINGWTLWTTHGYPVTTTMNYSDRPRYRKKILS